MLSYKPPKESRKKNLSPLPNPKIFNGYQSLMTRQSLFVLLSNLPQKTVILPRFVPAGVYHPLCQTGKSIIYYDVPNDLIIDTSTISNLHLDPADTIFYYIHQFGVHVKANIELMNIMQSKGYFVIDDRSLTLPVQNYIESADATAYSFYKLIGLPFGGQVRTKACQSPEYIPIKGQNAALMGKMRSSFNFFSNPVVRKMPSLPFRVYNRLLSKYVDYNHLCNGWSLQLPMLPNKIEDKLLGIDFNRVTNQRIAIARMYYRGLDPKLLLPIPIEAVSKQSMMGFPILVNNPLQCRKQLIRKGILAFQFTKIWWWDKSHDFSDLYKRNILLPSHQYLTHKQVQYIIDCVNDCCN